MNESNGDTPKMTEGSRPASKPCSSSPPTRSAGDLAKAIDAWEDDVATAIEALGKSSTKTSAACG